MKRDHGMSEYVNNWLNPYSGIRGIKPIVDGWAEAVIANGGTYTALHYEALYNRIANAIFNNYWDKIKLYGPLCGSDLNAALIQYRAGVGWEPAINVGFINADYAANTGIINNDINKYLDTNYDSNLMTLNSTFLGVYNRDASFAGYGVQTLGAAPGFDVISAYMPFTDGQAYSDMYNTGTGRAFGPLVGAAATLVSSRTSNSDHRVYQRGLQVGFSAGAPGGVLPAPGNNIQVFRARSIPQSILGNLSMYACGLGLTSAETFSFSTDEQVYQVAMSRGV